MEMRNHIYRERERIYIYILACQNPESLFVGLIQILNPRFSNFVSDFWTPSILQPYLICYWCIYLQLSTDSFGPNGSIHQKVGGVSNCQTGNSSGFYPHISPQNPICSILDRKYRWLGLSNFNYFSFVSRFVYLFTHYFFFSISVSHSQQIFTLYFNKLYMSLTQQANYLSHGLFSHTVTMHFHK